MQVSFQDALSWPDVPAQIFKQNGSATLGASAHEDNQFGGWAWVYFPLEGNYHPVMSVQTKCNIGFSGSCTAIYLPRVIDIASVQVQPATRLQDEKATLANLQLTLGLYVLDLIGFLFLIVTTVRETLKYIGNKRSNKQTGFEIA